MSQIHSPKAIETRYAGCMFRSRLEARWAVFFDALKVAWEYEPEGFVGIKGEKYLPDFFLPELAAANHPGGGAGVYVEVKGSDAQLKADAQKIASCIDYQQSPLAGHGLLILGQVPEDVKGQRVHHEFYYWYKGIAQTYLSFTNYNQAEFFADPIINGFDYYCENLAEAISCKPHLSRKSIFGWWNINVGDAYTAARSSRFEFGRFGRTI